MRSFIEFSTEAGTLLGKAPYYVTSLAIPRVCLSQSDITGRPSLST